MCETKIWAIWRKSNPHLWNSGDRRLIVVYDNPEDAENFLAIHPQYHYRSGYSEPANILEIEEIQLNKVSEYWNPAFP